MPREAMFVMHHVYDLISALSIVMLVSALCFTARSKLNLRRTPCLTHTLRNLLLEELRSFALSLFS